MSDKPSYLGLLNAISLAETRAHAYLSAWADVTRDPEVRAVLCTVAAREGEHGMSFAKRINELGFELQVTEDPHFEEQMAIATSTARSPGSTSPGASEPGTVSSQNDTGR